MPANRKPARYHIDQYKLEHGAYHKIRWNKGKPTALTEHYWVFPAFKDDSGYAISQHYFGLEGQTAAYLKIRSRAQAILDGIAKAGGDHPKPAHLSRAKSRLEKTMSLPELARRWEVDEETIRKQIRDKALRATRTSRKLDSGRGGNYRIAFEDILAFEDAFRLIPEPPTGARPQPAPSPTGSRRLGMPAKQAVMLSGLSRATFYRAVKKLTSAGTLAPSRVGVRGMKFLEADVEKIRAAVRDLNAQDRAVSIPRELPPGITKS